MSDRALLLGINNYKSISPLRGCANDVENITDLLVGTCGFPPDGIVTLIDAEVTKSRVRDEFGRLAKASQPGDRLVFHYSGHGSYTPSDNKDEPVDELLCLYAMEWGKPDTYLIDDDLGNLLRTVPDGVHLTVLLDCCHSGSGTRAIAPVTRSGKREAIGPRTTLLLENDPVAANRFIGDSVEASRPRFVFPPKKFQVSAKKLARSRAVTRTLTEELNHLLFAGARDDQSAADAYIAESYNGAFSYYFSKSVREAAGEASAEEVIAAVQEKIDEEGYSQVPQLEGPRKQRQAPVFGGEGTGAVAPVPGGTDPGPGADSTNLPGGASGGQGSEMLFRLITLAERFVELCEQLSGSTGLRAAPVGDEAWVAVHGISRHTAGYSENWWRSMAPFVTGQLERHEVLWSHHVNPRSLSRGEQVEAARLRAAIEAVLDERLTRELDKEDVTEVPRDLAARGDGFNLDDFLLYMFDRGIRMRILGEFTGVVEPLLRAGRTVHIVSHSWGTVVSYEGLRELEARGLPGRVANFFVVGSALSIGPVRRNLLARVGTGRKPRMVDRFVNIDAQGDFVGGRIAPHFAVDQPEFLDREAVGCRRIWPFPPSLGCAHGSYFDPRNHAVNRDLFAAFINARGRQALKP